jgi:hypothetical protein
VFEVETAHGEHPERKLSRFRQLVIVKIDPSCPVQQQHQHQKQKKRQDLQGGIIVMSRGKS